MTLIKLPSGEPELFQLLAESDFQGSYQGWRRAREIINKHIEANSRVLDVACGNGLLLASLLEWHPDVFMPYGFDLSAQRIKSAQNLLPVFAGNFYVHNLWKAPWPVPQADIVIAPWINQKVFIRSCLQHACTKVIFTAYDDELAKGLDLSVACRRCDLRQARIDTLLGVTQVAVVYRSDVEAGCH